MRTRLLLLAAVVAALLVPSAARAYTRYFGTVGPGFTITLKRANGTLVRRSGHGLRTFVIRDRSSIHNFHLFGPGVNRRTRVGFVGRRVWSPVLLSVGRYTLICDVHPDMMIRTFRVF